MDIKLYIGIFLAVIVANIISGVVPAVYLPIPYGYAVIQAIIVIILYFLLERFLIKGPA